MGHLMRAKKFFRILNFFSTVSLSERKNRYLKTKDHKPYQLVVEDYVPIIQHYIDKHCLNNTIAIVNGSTLFGERKISEKRAMIQEDINLFENEEIKYGIFIRNYWVAPGNSIPSRFYLNQIDNKHTDFSV